MGLLKEFKEFALKGNVLDLAVGVVVGAAFGAMVRSLVDDVMMPVLGLLAGGRDVTDLYWVIRDRGGLTGDETLAQAREAGAVVVAYGAFLNTVVVFLIVGSAVFLLVKAVNRWRRPREVPRGVPDVKQCPFCLSSIALRASRCPQCTSTLEE